jgi:phosphoribosylformylglycinamidine (FGAM) synthase-like amidotransferase family enzyme
VHVHIALNVSPRRVPILAGIEPDAVIPAWASHGDGRLVAPTDDLDRMEREGHIAFVYCERDGRHIPAPNGSARAAAALVNRAGNVLAIMPHPERDGWTYQHLDATRDAARGDTAATLAPSGGIALFQHFARAVRGEVAA